MAGVDDFNLDLDDLAADVIPVVKEGYLKKRRRQKVLDLVVLFGTLGTFKLIMWNGRYFIRKRRIRLY